MRISSCPVTPVTPRTPHTSKIFGQEVKDDYRWLESDTPARDEWLKAQTARTDCRIDSYPQHKEIKERLLDLFQAGNRAYEGPLQQGDGYSVQWIREEGSQHLKLMKSANAGEQSVVFDPSVWPQGETLGWTSMSPDRRYLAYARVLNGMDSGRMEILDLSSGDIVRNMDGANATQVATWSEKDDKLYFSASKGTPGFLSYDVSDAKATQLSPHWLAPYGEVAEHDGTVLFTTNSPAYLQEEAVLIKPDGTQLLTNIPAGRMDFAASGSDLYIQTTAEAPNGQVLMVDLSQAPLEGVSYQTLLPEVEGRCIASIAALEDGVAVSYTDHFMPGLAVYDREGKVRHEVKFDQPGVLSNLRADDEGDLKFDWTSLIQPKITKKLNVKSGEVTVLNESKLPGHNPDDYVVERKWYTSEDGTKVPLTLAHRKGLELDGSNPGHIYVYGGFNSAVDPAFSSTRIPFLEAGGVYAIAHVRGGSELGEQWHDQATGLNREKVYGDVASAARFLAQEGYSSSRHLAIEGASNGGLVAGVAVTRNPELFDAAVSEVGLHDMARYEQLGGVYWNQEYGTIEQEEQAKGLLSWSPYHNVKSGVQYPAVLVTTGKHDDRVNPAHSFKFAARLQEAQSPERPVYLRVEENLGHGHSATDEQWADRYADQWAFLLSELRDDDRAKVA